MGCPLVFLFDEDVRDENVDIVKKVFVLFVPGSTPAGNPNQLGVVGVGSLGGGRVGVVVPSPEGGGGLAFGYINKGGASFDFVHGGRLRPPDVDGLPNVLPKVPIVLEGPTLFEGVMFPNVDVNLGVLQLVGIVFEDVEISKSLPEPSSEGPTISTALPFDADESTCNNAPVDFVPKFPPTIDPAFPPSNSDYTPAGW